RGWLARRGRATCTRTAGGARERTSVMSDLRVPTHDEVQRLVRVIELAARRAAPYATATSLKERRHWLHFRQGGEPILRTLVPLGEGRGLNPGGAPPSAALRWLDRAERLELVAKATRGFLAALENAIFESRHESWKKLL